MCHREDIQAHDWAPVTKIRCTSSDHLSPDYDDEPLGDDDVCARCSYDADHQALANLECDLRAGAVNPDWLREYATALANVLEDAGAAGPAVRTNAYRRANELRRKKYGPRAK